MSASPEGHKHLLESLNPEQRAAVTLPHESALILAGAGSGKTRVLTTRIVWLIQTGQVSPHGILAVTFTNKAAKEMLTRISAMLPINTRGMWVGTFHGLANRLLRTHWREAGLPQSFQILDSSDQLSAIKRLMKAMNVDTEKYEPKKVQWFINSHKEAGRRARDAEAFDEYSIRMAELFEAYDAQCQREGVADFPELLLRSYELLYRNEPLRQHYRDRFKHILIDEFQDTNTLQYRWLKLFAGPHTALFAVGDDDQSIYAFRGANTANMAEFEREFAHGNVIKLEQNYRSHGHILTAANTLISQNAHRLGKNLWTAEGEGEPIRIFEAYSDQDEASFVVDEVKALNREGVALSDMALLYRSNAQSRVLEHALFSAHVPYRVYGGLRFFERQEVKHALAYLRLLTNPEDDGAFLRVVNFPARGIGARTLEQLADHAARSGTSLWQAACTSSGKMAGFAKLIEDIKQATADLPLAEVIDHVIETSGLADYYRADKDGADRLENLNELINAAALFSEEGGLADAPEAIPDGSVPTETPSELDRFLAHAALEAGEHQAGAGHDALQLMTVHAAKGLEFHAVFITGLEESLFPHEQSAHEENGLEEERRLMYVAITRARRRLYLSHAQSRMLHGQIRYSLPSRFLDELPEQVLLNLNRRDSTYPSGVQQTAGRYGTPAPRNPGNDTGYKVGQSVAHAKFGTGIIIDFEGRGADARVQVKFRDAGTKWLALAYAKLSPA
ncbi:UvrD-helicase domain-containing protein [Thiobacillus sp.]|uniref:UvrD-helicase domain-containing protein n=1 Tax=Thiobacillus sp. TaxID=924 RepID=UPI001837ADE0|nr:UvrD-helicase domain-containing protein [Thiobacillus sp.]MBC2730314.1 UvrD-helicase domain-containing protein [Thiobacillus sp.]MBC2739052.1 UvrD-helicase domain-containing protein [Thiobacillus sp.]MBC2760662.1 UvrD-helicase domain-containing protein [Thiobacillus sp.]